MSRSCLRTSTSRRSRRISSSWLVSLPLPGNTSPGATPARLSACRRQLRSMSARIPSSRATCEIGLPLSCAIRTASTLNSGVNCRRFRSMNHLLARLLPPRAYLGVHESGGTPTGPHGFPLLLNHFLHEALWPAASDALREVLSLPTPRTWEPRKSHDQIGAVIGTQPKDSDYWLPQLKARRKRR